MWQFSLSVAGDGKVVAGDGNSVCLVVVLVVILVAIVIILYLVSAGIPRNCNRVLEYRTRVPVRTRVRVHVYYVRTQNDTHKCTRVQLKGGYSSTII